MKTIPISKPGAGPQPTLNADVQKAAERRANAIAILEGKAQSQNAKPTPVVMDAPIPVNANAVSVEEMTAIQPPTLQNHSPVEESLSTQQQVQDSTSDIQEPSKPVEPQAESLSQSQLAILARKERALRAQQRQQQQEMQAKESQWAQEKAAMEKRLQELETGYIPKSSLKQAALEALNKGELSYEEITQEVMNPTDPRITAYISRLEAQVKDLTNKFDNAGKQAQEAQSQQYQAAVKQIETDVKNLVKVDPSYEMIKVTGSQRDVVELIEKTYQEDGYVMTIEEAAQQVEDYLVEEASKLARTEKITKRLAPPAPAVKKVEATEHQKQTPNTQQQSQQMKTLTNTNSGSRKLSSRERAILAFKGELKS